MAEPARIVFMGSDGIALPLLRWLRAERADAAQVVAVFTQPDRPVGRGQKVVPNAIKQWAQAEGIATLQPAKLTAEVRDELAALRPDLALVMAYGHILKDDFIATPRLGTVNFHASLLPAYRGASPIQTAVAEGESETGVSLMRIVRRLDAGPVADQESFRIGPMDTADVVEARLAEACVPLLSRNLDRLLHGSLPFREQDESAATFCRKLTKEDGRVDWRFPAHKIAARINGLYPWPGCTIELKDQAVKLGLAEAVSISAPAVDPGTIIHADRQAVVVAAADGQVRLLRLQRPGGRMLAAGEFLNGFPVEAGTVLRSAELMPLTARQPFRK